MLEKLNNALARAHLHEPPGSAFAKATRYVRNHWAALTRFLTDVLRKLRDDVPVTDLLPDRWHAVYGARDPQ